MIKTHWYRAKTWFDSRSLRERILSIVAFLAILLLFWQAAFLGPMQQRLKKMKTDTKLASEQVGVLEKQYQALISDLQEGQSQSTKAKHAELHQQLSSLNQRMALFSDDLIAPAKLASLLQSMLTKVNGLHLESIHSTRGSEKLDAIEQLNPLQSEHTGLYRYGTMVDLQGNYFSVVNYLKAVENSPWRIFWDGLDYQVKQYPDAKVKINIHTLSHYQK